MNKVYIKWMHGDADFYTNKSYTFKTLNEMRMFLNFIFDLRKFIEGQGWENLGHFGDGYEQSTPEWFKKINKKHKEKFGHLVEIDKSSPGNDSFHASVEHIWVEIDGVKHYIVWNKAIKKTVKVNLPKKGNTMNLTTGDINGYGPEVFGGTHKDYAGDEKFKDLGKPKGKGLESKDYPKLKAKVVDCKPIWFSLEYNNDFTAFYYVILLENERGKFTAEINGYDKNYEKKFGRHLYEKIKVIEV